MEWVEKEVETPYGAVRAFHRAVVNEADEPQKDDPDDDDEAIQNRLELEEVLERSADLLGSVLWNSITAALYYLHTHRLLIPQCIAEKNKKKNDKKGTSLSSSSTSPLSSLRVIELGAGVGSLGIALAMAGATTIISDIPELLPLMEKNIECNANCLKRKGAGKCVALGWQWGPSLSINVKKWWMRQQQSHQRPNPFLLSSSSSAPLVEQKKKTPCGVESALLSTSPKAMEAADHPCSKKRKREEEIRMSSPVPSFEGHPHAFADISSPSSSLVEPHPLAHLWAALSSHQSDAWLSAMRILSLSSSSSSSLSLHSPHPHAPQQTSLSSPVVDDVILCDALYGNPKDWPALLFTLSEILEHSLRPGRRNTSPTTIFNFCEQRVENVEKAFLELLEKENRRPVWRGEEEEAEDDEWRQWQQRLMAVMMPGDTGGASSAVPHITHHTHSPHAHHAQEKVGAVVGTGPMEKRGESETKRKNGAPSGDASSVPAVSPAPPPLPSTLSPSEVYAQASQYLLLRRLRQMRGQYVWDYQSRMLHEAEEEVVEEEEEGGVEAKKSTKIRTPMAQDSTYTVSALKMPIRVTRITWKLRE